MTHALNPFIHGNIDQKATKQARKAHEDEHRLQLVRIAAEYLKTAQEDYALQIRDAHAYGLSLRAISAAAGVSHTQVQRIVKSG